MSTETPAEFCRWLLTLDDPEDVIGREERRTVTLEQIIARARDAVAVLDQHECHLPAIDLNNLPRGNASWTCPTDGIRYTLVKRWHQEKPVAYWQRLPDYMQSGARREA